MRTQPLYPIGISSWEDVGFQVEGFGPGSTLELRVMDEDGQNQLYPTSGSIDILSMGGDSIDEEFYDHYHAFSGDWTSVDTGLDGPVIMEVYLTRAQEDMPAILEISLNYTVSFPTHYELTNQLHVVHIDNLTMTSSGFQLIDYKAWGSLIVGPIEKEDQWCDIIGVSLSSYSQKISSKTLHSHWG